MHEFVKVHNTGSKLLKFPIPRADGDRTPGIRYAEIAPGEFRIMKLLDAACAFGNPVVINTAKERGRVHEYDRMRTQWGFHTGYDTETDADLLAKPEGDRYGSWETKGPKFKVTTMNDAWIPMVLDDPEGLHPLPDEDGNVPNELILSSGSMELLRQQNLKMQAELDELKKMILVQAGSRSAVESDDGALPQPAADETVGVDAPKQTRVLAGKK
jgi:hypothetical protein